MKQLAALADEVPKRYEAMVLVAAWCGLRFGEVAELRRSDFGSGCEILSVTRAISRRDGVTRVDTTKGEDHRTVVVPPHIRSTIKHHLDVNVGEADDALLFPSVRGVHLNDKVFRDSYFQPAVAKVGVTGLVFHDLRRFQGTMATRAGGSLAEVMRRLGHKTVDAAMLYQAAVNGRDGEIAVALSLLAESPEVLDAIEEAGTPNG